MMLLAHAPPPLPATPLSPFDAILYGAVQGIGEFLPISSSTHLRLLSRLLEAAGRQPIDEVSIMLFHLPTLAAVCWVLRKEIRSLLGPQRALLWPLALATLITGALGYPLHKKLDAWGANLAFLGAALCVTGLIQLLVERFRREAREGPWTWDRGIAVGLGQALAGIPGLSRLGMSTCAGLLTGRPHVQTVVFSFLCALPVTAGMTALECHKALKSGEPGFWTHRVLYGAYPLGALVSFVLGVLTFRWLLARLRRGTLVPFGVYCVVLGSLTLIWPLTQGRMPPSEPAAPKHAPPTESDEKPRTPEGNPGLGGDGAAVPAPDQPDLIRPPGPPTNPLPPP